MAKTPAPARSTGRKPTVVAKPISRKSALPRKSVSPRSAKEVVAKKAEPPLMERLGIKPGFTLTLLGEPADFLKTLGKLPTNLKIRKTAQGDRDLTVWFPRNAAELSKRMEAIASAVVDTSTLWIAWPKNGSPRANDLTPDLIRAQGTQQGIVHQKSCAIDEDYAGLKFGKAKK